MDIFATQKIQIADELFNDPIIVEYSYCGQQFHVHSLNDAIRKNKESIFSVMK